MKLPHGSCHRCQRIKQLLNCPEAKHKVCINCRDTMMDELKYRAQLYRNKMYDEGKIERPDLRPFHRPESIVENAINLSYEKKPDAPFTERLDFVITTIMQR
jgi:hypothetical protein